jgi:hypothetical protein
VAVKENPKFLIMIASLDFRFFMAVSLEMPVFWDTAPCRLVEYDQRFRCAYCFHHHGDDVRL